MINILYKSSLNSEIEIQIRVKNKVSNNKKPSKCKESNITNNQTLQTKEFPSNTSNMLTKILIIVSRNCNNNPTTNNNNTKDFPTINSPH